MSNAMGELYNQANYDFDDRRNEPWPTVHLSSGRRTLPQSADPRATFAERFPDYYINLPTPMGNAIGASDLDRRYMELLRQKGPGS